MEENGTKKTSVNKLDRVNELKLRSRESIARTVEQKIATATLYGMTDVVAALQRCLAEIRQEGGTP